MKKYNFILLFSLLLTLPLLAQEELPHTHGVSDNKHFIKGGFGEFLYHRHMHDGSVSQHVSPHHFVLRMGYLFQEKWYFFGKIAVEHRDEFVLENLFLNYHTSDHLNLKGGLFALPIGLHNQSHTPDAYFGVQLPSMYRAIIPFEWNDMALGVDGEWHDAGLHYQLYLMTGFKSYTPQGGTIDAANGLRHARQTHHSSFGLPGLVGRVAYDGVAHLSLGMSALLHQTETSQQEQNDSTSLGITMLTADAKWYYQGVTLKGEVVYTHLSGASAYNAIAGKDVGQKMLGGYAEVGYNLLQRIKTKQQLVPFVRYGYTDTHWKVETPTIRNKKYGRQELTVGINYSPIKNVLLKADHTLSTDRAGEREQMTRAALCFLW